MKIIVFGATGDVGSRVAEEALLRGHEVTAVVRNENKLDRLPRATSVRVLDVTDTKAVARAMAGHDLAVSALRPPDGRETDLPELTKSVLDAAAESKTRVLVVGGAANLLMPDMSGHTVLTAPNFLPEAVKPIAAACFTQFAYCVAEDRADWTYFSPPAMLEPGQRTGHYRRGSDILLVDEAGHSKVSMEDFAVAMMDEAETPTENVKRVTVAY